MKTILKLLLLLSSGSVLLHAQETAAAAASTTATTPAAATSTNAAAAVAGGYVQPAPAPQFIEHLVDGILKLFDVSTSGNTWQRYAIAAVLLVGFYLLRRAVTTLIFGVLRKLASRTKTTLDDKLFPALEAPVATFIALLGAFAALKVLKLDFASDRAVSYGSTVAFSLTVFWFLLRAFSAVLDHAQEIARLRQMGIAAFMPWIKKSLIAIFAVVGLLMVVQSLGFNVSTILQGLGIGGLAFALAAQDTIANVFGSVVVATDQPFRVGDVVQIGAHQGTVEDIGLRSTRLRSPDRTLIVIPNKTVAAEAINNLTRMPQRRVDQTLGLTYDTTPEQMEAVVADLRGILEREAGVSQDFIVVRFTGFGAFSLDIQVTYFCADPDVRDHFALREKLNLAFMRAVLARGLAFAFPTQTVQLDGEVARRLASGGR